MDFNTFKELFEIEPVIEKPNYTPKEPLVSVCIQTYNQENYISKCIESVLAQKTNFQFEILLADDDSDDKTSSICWKYAQNHREEIRYFRHSRKNNIEVLGKNSANFITLYNFFSARGKYIAICEGDDYWGDTFKLQKQFDFMVSNPNYSICYHKYKAINTSGIEITTDLVSPLDRSLESKELLFPWIHPATLTIFFKNVFNQIPQEATEVLTLDVFLYTILGSFGPGKYLKNISPAFYRLQENGLWGQRDIEYKLRNKINTYNKIAQYYKRTNRKNISRVFLKRVYKLKAYIIYYHIKKLHFKKALKYLVQF